MTPFSTKKKHKPYSNEITLKGREIDNAKIPKLL